MFRVLASLFVGIVATTQVSAQFQCFTQEGNADCTSYVASFCSNMTSATLQSGCYTNLDGTICDLTYFSPNSTVPTTDECNTVLGDITKNCVSGGYEVNPITNVTWIASPNNGPCIVQGPPPPPPPPKF